MSGYLRRSNAVLASYSGLDRVFMLVQYSSPLLAYLLTRSTSFHGLSQKARRPGIAAALRIISSRISDGRMMFRFAGLLPIISWLASLYNPATTTQNRKLRTLQKAQAWSMLAYYPLEHAYYLASHGVITMTPAKQLAVIIWACRAWAVYVFLQLWHYSEEARTLAFRMRLLAEKRQKHPHLPAVQAANSGSQEKVDTDLIVKEAGEAVVDASLVVEEEQYMRESKTLVNGVMINLAYAPLTIHWSLEKGIFSSEIWTSVFGTLAAIGGLKASWAATA